MLTQADKALTLAERFGGGTAAGEFAPAGVRISRIAREHGTPFYLYHGEMIVVMASRENETLGIEL